MRVCIVGNFMGNFDEGQKNTSMYLVEALKKGNNVRNVHIRHLFLLKTIKELKSFRPEIIHYTIGPSIRGLMLIKIISKICGNPKIVISALRPTFNNIPFFLRFLTEPDLALPQSIRIEKLFKKYGWNTVQFPSGVDNKKFKPISQKERRELRRKWGFCKEAFIILHVGPINKARDLSVLAKISLQKIGEVLIVGSSSVQCNKNIVKKLVESGCIIWNRYIPNLEEVFGIADCFVFPVKGDFGAADFPLTILEAMAANLPVVTSTFGALEEWFNINNNGMYFCHTEKDFLNTLIDLKIKKRQCSTRELVNSFSWDVLAERLTDLYECFIEGVI